MKDNEKVILIVLGIIAVIVLPYFLYSKQAKIDTEATRNHCQELQVEYDRLSAMDENRDFYIEETERYDAEIATIVAGFPADVVEENTILFLLDTEWGCDLPTDEKELIEYDLLHGLGIRAAYMGYAPEGLGALEIKDDKILTAKKDVIEEGVLYRANVPVIFDSIAFSNNVEQPIASEGVDTGMWAVTNSSMVTYRTYYPGFKYLLAHFLETSDPMTYPSFSATFDKETATISGEFTLQQFAIIDNNDEDRVLEPANWVIEDGWDIDVDSTYGRGNEWGSEADGIFGPKDPTAKNKEDAEAEEVIEEYFFEDEE